MQNNPLGADPKAQEGVSGGEPEVTTPEEPAVGTGTTVPVQLEGRRRFPFVDRCVLWVKNHVRIVYGTFLVVLLVGLSSIALVYRTEKTATPVKQFTNVYSFVPEKISKSASIPVHLPEGVSEATAETSITFSPELKGSWVPGADDGVVVFDPEETLKDGVYYAVNMDTGSIEMSGDFYVDQDPRVESIVPIANSEASEDSEITIMFNRPMIPLTTLAEQEALSLPITITPETKGRFKWISTRSLQFIPETTLIPASHYEVKVGEGLVSLDGLRVEPFTHAFTTRALRYEVVPEGMVGYRSPMIIGFNQPVDLRETAKRISVFRGDGSEVALAIEYGETTTYDNVTGKAVTKEDRSKVAVFGREDKHGREKLWDFNTAYTIHIHGAVPLEGTISLDEERSAVVSVPNIIENIVATSERSSLTMPMFFDPEGKLVVTFYEGVDKGRSKISVKGLHDIAYGERCKMDAEGAEIQLGNGCEKEVDTRTLIFSFNKDAFGVGESFDLTFDRVVASDGFRLNEEPIVTPMRIYPTFSILRTLPASGAGDAPLDQLIVCSNSPLRDPGDAKVSSYVKTDGYIVYGRWSGSEYVDPSNTYGYYKCQGGEFQTVILYGLLPLTDYTIRLSLTDAFGQSSEGQITFKTKNAEEQYTRFHNLQLQYNVTRPEKTKLTYAVENLEYVDMHICRMTPETFLRRTINTYSETEAPYDGECSEVVRDHIVLPARYWVNNYFQVDLHKYFTDTRGHYVITFSNPLYRSSDTEYNAFTGTWTSGSKQRYDRTYVSVTNLAVGKKEVEYVDYGWSESSSPGASRVLEGSIAQSSNLYWVNDSSSLTPVPGASIVQYTGTGNFDPLNSGVVTVHSSGVTDGEGIARVKTDKNLIGTVIRAGADTAVVSDWADELQYASPAQSASRTYIYTDRPIYRPGHTVYIRGIDRIGFDGSYEVWQQDKAPLTLYDPMGNKVYDTSLSVSAYGTFNTQFELPADAPLGTYRIEVFGQSSWFDVEEYVPAAFKLEATGDKEEYTNGDTMKIDVQADYYFGVPLSEGTVTYSVTAQDYYFDRYTDEYFNFGNDWYYCYSCGYGDNFLFRGATHLDARGKAHIERQIKFSDYFDASSGPVGSKLFTVSITAQDVNGRSVSTQKSFIVHKGEFYIGAVTDKYYTGVNDPITLRVKTVDTNGKPLALSNITRTVYSVDWDTFKRQEVDGGFYYRSEKRLTEVGKETIRTDTDGNSESTITLSKEGQYEIHLVKTDDRGNSIETTSDVYIYGTEAVTVPPNNNYELDLEVEKPKVGVGDTASVLIKSPYDHAKVLITAERGTIYDYWVKDVTGGLYLHEFPIKSEYVPNVYLSVLLLSGTPEVKYGSARFDVGKERHALSVDVRSNKDHYLPGEEVTLDVNTKDSEGKPVPAEVSLAVADLSVLALKGNPKKDPLEFFYNGFPLSVSTASNIKNILHEVDIPLGTKGGGGDPNDLATKKRGLFKDTAFWNASVVTDSTGHAQISFTLPDNLTTWQIESVGITKDTQVGVDYAEFKTKKDLMAVPLKPRFVVPGDTFMLGAKVFNQTDKNATVDVKLESGTLIFTGESKKSVLINSGETKTIYFEVEAPGTMRAGRHTFTFTASSGAQLDSVEESIAITPNTTYETVATANMTKDTKSTEYLYVPEEVISGQGGLTINTNATLAVFMTDALNYMVTYPYGCSEQLASSLSTIGTLTKALTLPNAPGEIKPIEFEGVTYSVEDVVKNGLGKIYETQAAEGGFAYYKGLPSDLSLTLHVLTALTDLKEAGFEVREDVRTRAMSYIANSARIAYSTNPEANKEMIVLAEYVLRRANGNTDTAVTDIVKQLVRDDSFVKEHISSMSLAYLAIITADGWSNSDRKRVYDALINRIDIDGRGAYLKIRGDTTWMYYETAIKDTALLLRAFVAHKDENPQLGNVLRWLLASRDSQGVWGSTHNTFIVVDAMTEYLKWQHETEAKFDLTALLDGVALFTHTFDARNIFETFTQVVPIDSLTRKKFLPLTFDRKDLNARQNTLYYDMSLKYFLPVESLPPRDEGITITRNLYALDDAKDATPLTTVKVGDVVRGKLEIMVPGTYRQVSVEDIIPAGFEIVNFNLDTEDQSLKNGAYGLAPQSKEPGFFAQVTDRVSSFFGDTQTAQVYGSWGTGEDDLYVLQRTLMPSHIESHDDRLFLYTEYLSPGVYEYTYYLRALVPGKFQHLPARAEELYFPEVFGRTSGDIITVTED